MLAECGLITQAEADDIRESLEKFGKTSMKEHFVYCEQRRHSPSYRICTYRKTRGYRPETPQYAAGMIRLPRTFVSFADAIDRIDAAILELQRAFLEMAERERDLVIPAYTHLRRAQPVLAGHQLLVWCEKFDRDRQRLADCRQRTNIMPLGSAALLVQVCP